MEKVSPLVALYFYSIIIIALFAAANVVVLYVMIICIDVNVAIFVSNCKAAGAKERTAYVEELMKYIQVMSAVVLECR